MRPVIGWDTETHAIEDDLPEPPGVCLSASGGFDTYQDVLAWDERGGVFSDQILEVKHGADLAFEEWTLLVPVDRALDFLLHMLTTTDAVLVAHNQAYDWGIALKDRPDLLDLHAALVEDGRLVDSGVREQLWAIATDNFKFDHRLGKANWWSLADCVMARFGINISGSKRAGPDGEVPWRLRYKELDGVPLTQWPQAAVDYAVEDAVWARRLYLEQARALVTPGGVVVNEDGTLVNEREQFAFDWVLQRMAVQGVRTDGPAVEAFAVEVKAMVEEAEAAGWQAGFIVVNSCRACDGTGWVGEVPTLTTCPLCEGLDHDTLVSAGRYGTYKNGTPHTPAPPKTKKSTKRLKALVEHAYGGVPPLTKKQPNASTTWTPSTSTDADTLKGSGQPLLMEYAKGSFAIKLRDTYLPQLRRGTEGPIHSSPRVLKRSGRTAWSDPNFQNPPQRGGFRECFVPEPGNVFASIDYNMLEMCTLAQVNLHLFGYSRMAEAINEGRDLHSDFGSQLAAGWTYEQVDMARKDKSHPRHAEAKNLRDRAKVGNFGFPGGLGPAAMVEYARGYGLTLDMNEAEDLKAAWLDRWEEMKDYFRWISAKAGDWNSQGTYYLKQLGSERVRGGCTYTSGANTMFQGLAADGAKAAGWSLYKACYTEPASPLFGVRMWAFVHDEFLFEGPEDTAHLWAPHAADMMIRDMRRYTPDVNIGAEPALMRRWSKEAAPACVAGRLVPWEDVKR